jgi:hypothetical protein
MLYIGSAILPTVSGAAVARAGSMTHTRGQCVDLSGASCILIPYNFKTERTNRHNLSMAFRHIVPLPSLLRQNAVTVVAPRVAEWHLGVWWVFGFMKPDSDSVLQVPANERWRLVAV